MNAVCTKQLYLDLFQFSLPFPLVFFAGFSFRRALPRLTLSFLKSCLGMWMRPSLLPNTSLEMFLTFLGCKKYEKFQEEK